MDEGVTMIRREVDRLEVVQRAVAREIAQGDAARQLGLSVRQVKRLVRAYRCDRAAGLVSHVGWDGAKRNPSIEAQITVTLLGLLGPSKGLAPSGLSRRFAPGESVASLNPAYARSSFPLGSLRAPRDSA